jgi:putative ABC transport system substrate-binding protein
MDRRRFLLTSLAGVLAAPLAVEAQKARKAARVGVLLFSNPRADPGLPSFRQGLRELGYVEGQTIVLEYRFAEGRAERLADAAAELASLKPDVLVGIGGDVAPFAKRAAGAIPVVFLSSADPIRAGLVASLARPGGNATGITLVQDELSRKRMQLFKEAAPRISRVAVLWNPDHPDPDYREAERAAGLLGVEVHSLEVRSREEFDRVIQTAARARVDALLVVTSRLMLALRQKIMDFVLKERLPMAGGFRGWVDAGALISYGPDFDETTRRVSVYVDKILKGARPADLPVEQPTRFDLIINLKTAKALGLTIPPSVLLQADQVIE